MQRYRALEGDILSSSLSDNVYYIMYYLPFLTPLKVKKKKTKTKNHIEYSILHKYLLGLITFL